jgi:hypothetical protein
MIRGQRLFSAWAERLDGSYLRTFALELKEQLAVTLVVFVTSILAGPRVHLNTAEPPFRQIIDVLEQVMCTETLAIYVLEICGEYPEPLLAPMLIYLDHLEVPVLGLTTPYDQLQSANQHG